MEEKKVYTFKQLKAEHIFIMCALLGKIGLDKFRVVFQNADAKKLIADVQAGEEVDLSNGAGVFLEFAQIILENIADAKEEIYNLLEATSNLNKKEIAELDIVTFAEMIIDFCKKDELPNFMKAVSKFALKN